MVPYFILIGVPAIFALFVNFFTFESRRFKFNKWIIGSFFIIMIILLSCRNIDCGIDVANYEVLFNETIENKFMHIVETYDIEYGYHMLEYLIATTTSSFRLFLITVALISLIPIWMLYKKESKMPYLSVVIFAAVCPFSLYFSGLRQVCAMAFVVPAYHLVKKKNFMGFVLVVILAASFHISALMIFLLYPLYYIRFGRKTAIAFMCVAGAVLVTNESIFKMVLTSLGGKYAEKYSFIQNTGAYTTLILLVIFMVYSYVIPDEEHLDEDTRGLRNILYVLVIIQCFAPINTLVMRLNYYYLILLPILIPKIVMNGKKSLKTVTNASVYVMCIFFTFWFVKLVVSSEDVLQVFPYLSMWS